MRRVRGQRLYRVIVEGRNCFVDFDGQIEKHGFFATRFVHAADEQEARKAAIEIIQHDLQGRLLNVSKAAPLFRINELVEVGQITPPNSGFTWYPESEDVQ